MTSPRRVGARVPALVPEEIKSQLEGGAPSVNHMEQIAMDMGALVSAAIPGLAPHANRLRRGGLVARMREGGRVLADAGPAFTTIAASHQSDTVRGWAAMAVAADPSLDLPRRLVALRPFAADDHFAVREWAWLAARPAVVAEPHEAIQLLATWACDHSPWIRRFASEATRPRGVWSVHIPELKRYPEAADSFLDSLRYDISPYVQNSVGNWLNDAARTRADWVRVTCARWLNADPSVATQRICARGLRTLRREERRRLGHAP